MKTPIRKIASIKVWIVGHPQNSLIAQTGEEGAPVRPLAVFYKKREAQEWRRKHGGIYKLIEAVVDRLDGTGLDCRKMVDEMREAMERNLETFNATQAENARLKNELAEARGGGGARLTPRAQAALALAAEEALAQGTEYIGTEHLLLGMLRQTKGLAARHFIACGMTHAKAEYAVRVSRVS
jgi:ATP-dependent Clp protease ATP-binding subunit ClpA